MRRLPTTALGAALVQMDPKHVLHLAQADDDGCTARKASARKEVGREGQAPTPNHCGVFQAQATSHGVTQEGDQEAHPSGSQTDSLTRGSF